MHEANEARIEFLNILNANADVEMRQTTILLVEDEELVRKLELRK